MTVGTFETKRSNATTNLCHPVTCLIAQVCNHKRESQVSREREPDHMSSWQLLGTTSIVSMVREWPGAFTVRGANIYLAVSVGYVGIHQWNVPFSYIIGTKWLIVRLYHCYFS